MGSNDSLQFQEPAEHLHMHPSSSTDTTESNASGTVNPSKTVNAGGASTHAPAFERQGSVSKIANVAKKMVKSPAEEKEVLQLEKTLEQEVKKGPKADVKVMEA